MTYNRKTQTILTHSSRNKTSIPSIDQKKKENSKLAGMEAQIAILSP